MVTAKANQVLEDVSDEAYSLQELGECIKWLAEAQIFCGSKEDTNFYNGDKASGSWYAAKITQTIAEKIIDKSKEICNALEG